MTEHFLVEEDFTRFNQTTKKHCQDFKNKTVIETVVLIEARPEGFASSMLASCIKNIERSSV